MPESATESQSGPPQTRRLVVRVKILSEVPSEAPVRRHFSRGALLLILGVVAVSLSWVGIRMFKDEPASVPVATEGASNSQSQSPASQSPAPAPARSEAVPAVGAESLPQSAREATESKSVEVEQPTAAPSPLNEVIPNVPQGARDTIRGTIRVSVRVIVDAEGKVLAATADDGGPSRYFERLAIRAAKNWTFTPATSQEQ